MIVLLTKENIHMITELLDNRLVTLNDRLQDNYYIKEDKTEAETITKLLHKLNKKRGLKLWN